MIFLFFLSLESLSDEEVIVSRQSYAGLLWSKQFYYYVIDEWLKGDPSMPCPPHNRLNGRNSEWKYLHNKDVISMPDKWEYPWVSFTLKLRSSFWRNNVFSTRFISFFSMYIENIFNSYQNGSPHIRCAFKLAKNRDSPPPINQELRPSEIRERKRLSNRYSIVSRLV